MFQKLKLFLLSGDGRETLSWVPWKGLTSVCLTLKRHMVAWLRHYATSLSPDEVIEFFFNLPNPSRHAVALWLIEPLTEMCIRKCF
jgi:hypothetical protein